MKIIISFFIFSHVINATIKRYIPSSLYPSELQALLFYVDLNSLTSKRRERLEQGLKTIEITQAFLKKHELSFLVKTCIYKAILSNTPENKIKKFPKRKARELLLKRFREDEQILFDLWPLESIVVDIDNLEKKTNYFNYYNNKKGRIPDNFQSYQRKTQLLLGWFYFFRNESREEIYEHLGKLSENIIYLLSKQLHFYVYKTKVYFKKDALQNPYYQLTSFQIKNKDEKKMIESTKSSPSLEDIIDPIIKNEDMVIPNPTNDWIVPKEKISPDEKKNIITMPTDEIESKGDLPQPINDWIFSEYDETEDIPNPKNDWIVSEETISQDKKENIITMPTDEIESKSDLPKPINDWSRLP